MNWPWKRQAEIDVAGIAERVAVAAAEKAAREMAEGVQRALATNVLGQQTDMAGAPGRPGANYPLYAFDNPIWFSTPQTPRRRPGSLITVEVLRQLADRYDVLRACIQHLKREVRAVPLEIVPRDPTDSSAATQAAIKEATAWFAKQGGLGGVNRRRAEFESQMLEDMMVIGSAAIYYRSNRGGGMYEAIAVDAATIRPRVDAYGWPGPGEEWYEQWIYGVKVAGFTPEEMDLIGLSDCARTWTPYFASPVEWLVNCINSALRADEWNRNWLSEGNTPSTFFAAPTEWTPEQIMTFQQYMDAMLSGDSRERVKVKVVPGGGKFGELSRKDQEFSLYELWLLRRTCSIMGVQPASIGFAGEQYKVTQEASMEATSTFGVATCLDARTTVYNDILERLGYPEIQVRNNTAREEKAGERADRVIRLFTGGVISRNEARQEQGLNPVEGGDTVFVPSSLRPLDDVLTAAHPAESGIPREMGKQRANSQRASDLALWQRKALKRLQEGRSAACHFESDRIPESERQRIAEGLKACRTADQVRALFRETDALQETISQLWQARRQDTAYA